jgi:hypothetical protein
MHAVSGYVWVTPLVFFASRLQRCLCFSSSLAQTMQPFEMGLTTLTGGLTVTPNVKKVKWTCIAISKKYGQVKPYQNNLKIVINLSSIFLAVAIYLFLLVRGYVRGLSGVAYPHFHSLMGPKTWSSTLVLTAQKTARENSNINSVPGATASVNHVPSDPRGWCPIVRWSIAATGPIWPGGNLWPEILCTWNRTGHECLWLSCRMGTRWIPQKEARSFPRKKNTSTVEKDPVNLCQFSINIDLYSITA